MLRFFLKFILMVLVLAAFGLWQKGFTTLSIIAFAVCAGITLPALYYLNLRKANRIDDFLAAVLPLLGYKPLPKESKREVRSAARKSFLNDDMSLNMNRGWVGLMDDIPIVWASYFTSGSLQFHVMVFVFMSNRIGDETLLGAKQPRDRGTRFEDIFSIVKEELSPANYWPQRVKDAACQLPCMDIQVIRNAIFMRWGIYTLDGHTEFEEQDVQAVVERVHDFVEIVASSDAVFREGH
jgi:hypothetical protein